MDRNNTRLLVLTRVWGGERAARRRARRRGKTSCTIRCYLHLYLHLHLHIQLHLHLHLLTMRDQAGRGSLEISSALVDFLEKNINEDGKENVRLFCDGCGGQNKNNTVVHALMNFLEKRSHTTHIQNITLYFPVRGHTFLPAEFLEGVLECLQNVWYGKSVRPRLVYKGYKNLTNLQKAILVKGQTFLRSNEEVTAVTLLKRGFSSKKAREFILQVVPLQHSISQPKKKDVDSLLKELFGEAWRECEAFPQRQWYVDIIDSRTNDKL
ncbi:hypothetical protein J6590_085015 [Homalodisca vitripennis]|nr:hypothetical protein J6590_085015 [Homalodisca vitripennis]